MTHAPSGTYSGVGLSLLLKSGWKAGRGLGKEHLGRVKPIRAVNPRTTDNRLHGLGCSCKQCGRSKINYSNDEEKLEILTCEEVAEIWTEIHLKQANKEVNGWESMGIDREKRHRLQLELMWDAAAGRLDRNATADELSNLFLTYVFPLLEKLFHGWSIKSEPKKYMTLLQGWLSIFDPGTARYCYNRLLVPRLIKALMQCTIPQEFMIISEVWDDILPNEARRRIGEELVKKLLADVRQNTESYSENVLRKNGRPHPADFFMMWRALMTVEQKSEILDQLRKQIISWPSTLDYLWGWLDLIGFLEIGQGIGQGFVEDQVRRFQRLAVNSGPDQDVFLVLSFCWSLFLSDKKIEIHPPNLEMLKEVLAPILHNQHVETRLNDLKKRPVLKLDLSDAIHARGEYEEGLTEAVVFLGRVTNKRAHQHFNNTTGRPVRRLGKPVYILQSNWYICTDGGFYKISKRLTVGDLPTRVSLVNSFF